MNLTLSQIASYLKKKHNLVLGEVSLQKLKREIDKISRKKIKVLGRCLVTGKKKGVNITLTDLLSLWQ